MKRKITMLIIDVDGTLTDSSLYYDNTGNEIKKFSTKDAAAFFVAHDLGIKIMILTGRECIATKKRMSELKVDFLFENIKDKKQFIHQFLLENDMTWEQIGYIGDDLNDLASMKLSKYSGCPSDSCQEIKNIANYVSLSKGGHGAVRDIIEHMLRMSNEWDNAVLHVYGCGI